MADGKSKSGKRKLAVTMDAVIERQLFSSDYAGAVFDSKRIYRYVLWRLWNRKSAPLITIMLNPSTADEEVLDPTVKKCIKWAQAWGYGGIYVLNAFALRSTDPELLVEFAQKGRDPIGPENDFHIIETLAEHSDARVIVGWGKHAALLNRQQRMVELLAGRALYCLGVNKDGSPEHPLYVALATQPKVWRFPGDKGNELMDD